MDWNSGWNWIETNASNILGGLIGSLILATLVYILKKINPSYKLNFINKHLQLELFSYLSLCITCFILWLNFLEKLTDKYAFFTAIFFATLSVFIKILHFSKLRKLGIIAFDREMKKGFSSEIALKMVCKNFDFIGIGANKIIYSSEFNDAVERCIKNNGKIRFILCDPQSSALTQMAKLDPNVTDLDEFRRKVDKAHTEIKAMIVERGWPIELYIYSAKDIHDLPAFRLLVIDYKTYVSSYSVYGLGDYAGELPQLICTSPSDEHQHKTFSYAFESYRKSMLKASSLVK